MKIKEMKQFQHSKNKYLLYTYQINLLDLMIQPFNSMILANLDI